MNKHYPLHDYLSLAERKALGMSEKQAPSWPGVYEAPGVRARAFRTHEFRAPRKGEWYLSGAIVEAYRAPNDLGSPYHIARLGLVKAEVSEREIQPGELS